MQIENSTEFADKGIIKNFPFKDLVYGYSFFIPCEMMKEASLRAAVSAASNKFGKLFKCLKGTREGYYEITVGRMQSDFKSQIYEASAKAKELSGYEVHGRNVLPFEELKDNECFVLPITSCNIASLRVTCSKKSKLLKTKFVCVKHEAEGVVEIARLPVSPVQFFSASPEALAKGNGNEN